MARSLTVAAAIAVLAIASGRARAQTTAEADVTVGSSSQGVTAAASQGRVFGELPRGWRFYGDTTWALRRGPESDAFGAAYPYEPELRLMEAYLEKTSARGNRLLGTRVGRYRTPFGIYGRGDHGYTGFVRAPMIRYSDYWTISNNYLEAGASVIGGVPWLSAEASVGVPSDEDEFARRRGVDGVVRVQSARGNWISGASHLRTRPSDAWGFARGPAVFSGVDGRWMQAGIQVRGEWLTGRPFDGARTRGGYLDLLVHRPAMGPVTLVSRIERLDYFAGPFSRFPRRFTAGVKVRGASWLVGQVNVVHQPRDRTGHEGHASIDAALTFTARARR
ncbi:MAG: hypothetical protein AB7I13_02050 [Vicinamibacterales bacterium]